MEIIKDCLPWKSRFQTHKYLNNLFYKMARSGGGGGGRSGGGGGRSGGGGSRGYGGGGGSRSYSGSGSRNANVNVNRSGGYGGGYHGGYGGGYHGGYGGYGGYGYPGFGTTALLGTTALVGGLALGSALNQPQQPSTVVVQQPVPVAASPQQVVYVDPYTGQQLPVDAQGRPLVPVNYGQAFRPSY